MIGPWRRPHNAGTARICSKVATFCDRGTHQVALFWLVRKALTAVLSIPAGGVTAQPSSVAFVVEENEFECPDHARKTVDFLPFWDRDIILA